MEKLILWLSGRKKLTVMISGLYLASVIFFHKGISWISDQLSAKLSFNTYNRSLFLISLVTMVFFIGYIVVRIIKGERRLFKTVGWLSTVFLAVVSYQLLVVFNVEVIHYPQYAILAVPVFALLRSFGGTIFWTTLLGAFDEAYQYFVLHPDTHFDFNDVVLNLIGAGIGVMLIYTLADLKSGALTFHTHSFRKWNKIIIVTVAAFILIGGASLYAAGILRYYPEKSAPRAMIVLRNQPPPKNFWATLTVGKPYHQLSWVEGIFFSAALIAGYSLMDYRSSSRKKW